jgi:ABC-type Fe3+/spermidine/putrescine transport system ATPase subunit
MASALVIEDVSRAFDVVRAVHRCSFTVEQGEIIALLGPSGCGKTTLLNLIAGFETPDEGRIVLAGRDITSVPAHQRHIGMVFQHYALFPHMTVARNICYGPRVQRVPDDEATSRMQKVAGLLKIQNLLDRYPSQLSGGQRQRVAVARALAIRPELLLLDEAFSALDRNLREEMQIELSLLLRQLEITTILVTHDQREAFALADRIAVMEAGNIGQIGSPETVYRNPVTPFVFDFLGSSNRLAGDVVSQTDGISAVAVAKGVVLRCKSSSAVGSRIAVGVRAESVRLSRQPTEIHRTNPASVRLVTFLGQTVRHLVDADGTSFVSESASAGLDDFPKAGDPVFLEIGIQAVYPLERTGAS